MCVDSTTFLYRKLDFEKYSLNVSNSDCGKIIVHYPSSHEHHHSSYSIKDGVQQRIRNDGKQTHTQKNSICCRLQSKIEIKLEWSYTRITVTGVGTFVCYFFL